MENIKGIIFDYGGTIDTRGDHWSIIIGMGYEAAHLEIPRADFRDAYVYAERELARVPHILPRHNFYDLLFIKMRIEMARLVDLGFIAPDVAREKAPVVARFCYDYARTCVEEARPVLEALSARFPLVLVSNFYGNVASVLADFSLDRYFKAIVESAVVGVRKPDPRIFSLGVEALGLRPDEVLVVGDSLRKDILPAESIGCRVAWIKGRGWTPQEDAATHPSVIPSLTSLLSLLS